MRLRPLTFLTLALVACAPADEPMPEETAPAAEAAPDAPVAPSLADFAGTWQNTVTLEGVADPIPSTTHATADANGWTMTLEGRDPIALQPTLVGDSLVLVSAPYESILRPGVMTTVRTASVLQDGMLMGNAEVTYQTPAGEEKVRGTVHGTRAP